MMETIYQRIKRLRIEKGMTQIEVAKELNINQNTYSGFESGKNKKLDIKRIMQLAVIFNVDSQEILSGFVSEEKRKSNAKLLRQNVLPDFNKGYQGIVPTKKEENHIKIMRQLSREDLKKVVALLNELHQNSKKNKK